jgi:5-(carboxyamino)imidazole ribonucleotide mutase
VALNAAKNAGLLAAQIIGAFDPSIASKMADYKTEMKHAVEEKAAGMKSKWPNQFDQ